MNDADFLTGTVLLGRRSYEGFSSYWPRIADAHDDPDNRTLSDDNRELSRIYNALDKGVVTDSYTPPEDNPWRSTTTVVRRDQTANPNGSTPIAVLEPAIQRAVAKHDRSSIRELPDGAAARPRGC